MISPMMGWLTLKLQIQESTVLGVSDTFRNEIPGTRRIDYLNDIEPVNHADLELIADNHNTLILTTDKATISANGLDVVIVTTETPGALNVRVWLDGNLRGAPEVLPDGDALYFATDTPGSYTIEFEEPISKGTGYAEIRAI